MKLGVRIAGVCFWLAWLALIFSCGAPPRVFVPLLGAMLVSVALLLAYAWDETNV